MNKGSAARAKARTRLREAIHWFVTHETEEEDLRGSPELGWNAWCARSENQEEYAKVVRLRNEIAALPRPTLPSPEVVSKDVAGVNRARVPPASEGSARRVGNSPCLWSRNRTLVSVVGAALLAVASVLVYRTQETLKVMNLEQSYATAPGEQREFSLPDGSKIRLGGDTALLARFTVHARTIKLDRGEAFFWVQHNPRQPFVVAAAGGTTTAIGTAFEVRRYASQVQVWVKEGAVEVAPLQETSPDAVISNETARWASVRVAGGEEVTYNARGEASTPRRADPRVTAAWAEGHLVPLIYRGRTLQEVIDEVQPYSRRRIIVDPAAADLQYTGIVIQEDVDAWIRDLPSIYPDVDVIDCRTSKYSIPGCSDPERIVIRSRLNPHDDAPQSALR
jgi:transmembrane sensor